MKRTTLAAFAVAVLLSTAGFAPASILNSSVRRDALDDMTDGSQAPLQPSFSTANGDHSSQAVQEMAKKKKGKKKKSKAS